MVYQPGVPTGLVNLDVDYQNLQDNFTVLNNVFGVDHTTFDNATSQKGYHTVIHIINNSGTPPTVANTGQLYTRTTTDVNSDNTLFFKTGNGGGRILQLTSNFTPTAATNGYTFIPGGIIVQWGNKTGLGGSWPTSEQTLNFNTSNINFPNNCFSVWTTFIGPKSSSSGDICINSVSTANFKWQFTGSSDASYGGFYWLAIGN